MQHYSKVGDMLDKTQSQTIRERMDVLFAEIEVGSGFAALCIVLCIVTA